MSELARSPLTAELADALIEALKTCVPEPQVALSCGVDPETLSLWLAWGMSERATEPYASFAERWGRVESGMQQQIFSVWLTEILAKRNWLAAKDLLATRWPERYGRDAKPLLTATERAKTVETEADRRAMLDDALSNPDSDLRRTLERHGYQQGDSDGS